MFSSLVLVLLTQLACSPGDMSAVCNCKSGMLSACATVALENPEKAAEILARLEQAAALAKVVEEAGQKAESEAEAQA
ncbi:MAG TPA: Wall-associated protein precursor, partial [Archangium sp.]